MEKLGNQAFTQEEAKAWYDDWQASLNEDEQKLFGDWDKAQNTPFEKRYLDFLDENNDGSSQANENIFMYAEGLEKNLQEAKKSGNVEHQKVFEMLKRLKVPMTVPDNNKQDQSNDESSQPTRQMPDPGNDNRIITSKTAPSAQSAVPQSSAPAAAPVSEKKEEKIDLKAKIKEFVEDLPYEQKKELKKHEFKWENTSKQWMDGFVDYLENKVNRAGKYGITMLKDYVRDLKREYENISYSDTERKDERNRIRGEHAVMEKILGLYTSDKKETQNAKGSNQMEKLKSIWGWENIKKTMANIRRQIFELVGQRDPWFDYSQLEAGMDQTEKRAVEKSTALPPPSPDEGLFMDFLRKKETKKAAKNAPSTEAGASSADADAGHKSAA